MDTLTCIPTLPDPIAQRNEFAQQLHDALVTIGSAYIPISSVLKEDLLNRLKAFFALDELQKRTLANQLTAPWQGVFLPLGEEQLAGSQEDYKEVLDINLEGGTYARWSNQRKTQQGHHTIRANDVNINALMPIVQPLYEVFEAFQSCANQVLAALETAYSQPTGSLVHQHGQNSTLRILHYPPVPHLALGSIRLGMHQDYSGITLLWQDATGGLEILTPANEWVAVDIPAGCIGVIVGEVTQRWSGDTLHSAPHRVRVANVQQLQNARYSIAFFCETNSNCVVYPGSLLHPAETHLLDGSVGRPIAVEQFLTQKYDQIMNKVNF